MKHPKNIDYYAILDKTSEPEEWAIEYDMSFLFDRQTGDVYLPKRYPGAETKARAEKAGQIIILDDDWSGLNMDGWFYINMEREIQDLIDNGESDIAIGRAGVRGEYRELAEEIGLGVWAGEAADCCSKDEV